jgi:hypothetical protein
MKVDDPDLVENNKQIDWVLSCPDMSAWLKQSLTAARDRDPIHILNDLEILNHLLQARSNIRTHSMLKDIVMKHDRGK